MNNQTGVWPVIIYISITEGNVISSLSSKEEKKKSARGLYPDKLTLNVREKNGISDSIKI